MKKFGWFFAVLAMMTALTAGAAVVDINVSIDDLVAGRTVEFTGDVDLTGGSVLVTGNDFSVLDRNRTYEIAHTSGGNFIAANVTITADLPEGWNIRIRGSRITLRATSSAIRVVFEGAK